MPEIPLAGVIAQCDHLFNSGRSAEVGDHLRHWLAEARRFGDRKSELSILNELIGRYRMDNDPERGIAAVDDALKLLADLQQSETVSGGTVLLNAATALHSFGKYGKAGELYHSAYRAYALNLPENDQRFAGLFNNMAAFFAASGDLESAGAYYLEALEVLKDSGNLMDTAVTWVNLAQLGPNADEYFDRAMAIFDSRDAVRDGYYAHSCGKCAGAFRDAGRSSDAEVLENRAKEFYENH